MSHDHVLAHYAAPQSLTAPDGPIHVGWWDAPHPDLARAERDYEDHLTSPLALEAGTRVLDVGCGFGALARRLAAERGCKVDGIDLVPHHVTRGREAVVAAGLSDRVALHEGDVTALPFDDARFDAAIALEVLLHLGDRAAAARELARCVAPGGLVVVSDYLLHPPEHWQHALARGLVGAPLMGTEAGYVADFEAAGFELVSAEDVSARTLVAFYDWSRATRHEALRGLVARTVSPVLTFTTPLVVALGRWSAASGRWGLHFLTFRRV